MFDPEEIQHVTAKHFISQDVKVLRHEAHYNSAGYFIIKAEILIENLHQSEVRYVAKQITYPNELVCNNNKSIHIDRQLLIPSYRIKDYLFMLEEGFIWALPSTGDLDHIKLALKTVAKYHANNFNLEGNSDLCTVQISDKFWSEAVAALGDLVSTEELNKIVQHSLVALATINFQKVVTHGSLCEESLLFKYQNNAPVECKLLNFNRQQYQPPEYDVLHLIYKTTNAEFRKNHFHELLKFYYDCLKFELEQINLNIVKLLPLEEDFEISIHYLLPLIKVQLANLRQLKFNKKHPEDVSYETHKKLLEESISDLNDLIENPGITLEDCYQIVSNKIGTHIYDMLKYQVLPIGNVVGFFGDHRKLRITIRQDNQVQTFDFFVKFTPKGNAQKSIADDCGSFFKEHFFYRHFVPMAQEVGATIINECTVPCYLTRLDDVMVFEDFGIRNYANLNHRQPLNYEEIKLIVKQIAKFHASSIILEEKLTEKTNKKYCLKDEYEKGLQESFFNKIPNHQGARSMEMSAEVVEDTINLFPDMNSTLSDDEFKKKIKKVYEKVYDLVKPSDRFRNAICHGDLWVSNILVKKTNEIPIDCRFVDFQIMRYCPPAHDLLGFIHLTTNRSFRKAHMSEMIGLYHEELSRALEAAGCDADKIYSYKNFLESVEYMMPQTVAQTCIYYHICITNPDLMKDYMATEEQIKQIFLEDRRDFVAEMCQKDPIYKERNWEAVQDFRELCAKYF